MLWRFLAENPRFSRFNHPWRTVTSPWNTSKRLGSLEAHQSSGARGGKPWRPRRLWWLCQGGLGLHCLQQASLLGPPTLSRWPVTPVKTMPTSLINLTSPATVSSKPTALVPKCSSAATRHVGGISLGTGVRPASKQVVWYLMYSSACRTRCSCQTSRAAAHTRPSWSNWVVTVGPAPRVTRKCLGKVLWILHFHHLKPGKFEHWPIVNELWKKRNHSYPPINIQKNMEHHHVS